MSVNFNFEIQIPVPPGQEIKSVSINLGEPRVTTPLNYPYYYTDEQGQNIPVPYLPEPWPTYYFNEYGQRIEVPSHYKIRRMREEREQRTQMEIDRIISEGHTQLRLANRRRLLDRRYKKQFEKEINWKEEGF